MIEACRYRGYEIEPHQQWSNWCVSVHPTRPDLPILFHSTLQILNLRGCSRITTKSLERLLEFKTLKLNMNGRDS